MEEVDKIIIESLRHLNCDIDEDINSLKNFTPDTVVAAVCTCLESMNPQLKLPKKLPSSMSSRIKFASNLAQQIKDIGFKGDMGYQTILYCNEVEVRRVLMFLLEHLPKEAAVVDSVEPMGYVPKIVKQIEDSLRESLGRFWLPSEVCPSGVGKSIDDRVDLLVPREDMGVEEAALVPPVSLQCSLGQLLPSVLFEGAKFAHEGNLKEVVAKFAHQGNLKEVGPKLVDEAGFLNEIVGADVNNEEIVVEKSRSDVLLGELRQKKDVLIGLQTIVNDREGELITLKQLRQQEQKLLKEATNRVKVKNKTLAVLSNQDNKLKLLNLIQKAENRLVELANQWREVQGPLLQEHEALKSTVSSETLKLQDKETRLHQLKTTYKDLVADFKDKTLMEEKLVERCRELNNKNTRAAYTKRIMEIVSNINKQKKEIQKILLESRQVQKDINNLTGQVDRSFTLSDELIFYDCKHEETARKAYKLLAALRGECNNILQAVSDLGQAERELRHLEEQLEIEKTKDIRDKLDKVQRDLEEICKEIGQINK